MADAVSRVAPPMSKPPPIPSIPPPSKSPPQIPTNRPPVRVAAVHGYGRGRGHPAAPPSSKPIRLPQPRKLRSPRPPSESPPGHPMSKTHEIPRVPPPQANVSSAPRRARPAIKPRPKSLQLPSSALPRVPLMAGKAPEQPVGMVPTDDDDSSKKRPTTAIKFPDPPRITVNTIASNWLASMADFVGAELNPQSWQNPMIPALTLDVLGILGISSRCQENKENTESKLTVLMKRFPPPPPHSHWKDSQPPQTPADATASQHLRRGTVAVIPQSDSHSRNMSLSVTLGGDGDAPGEDQNPVMATLWKAITNEGYDHASLSTMLHGLTIGEAKLFQDRVHESLAQAVLKRRPLPKLKMSEPLDLEMSKRHLDFGLGVDNLIPLNVTIEDSFEILNKGRKTVRFKFLPLHSLPLSVKMKFIPNSGSIRKRQKQEIRVSLLVTSTINSRLLEVMDIEGVKHFFTIRFMSEHSLFGVEYSELKLAEDYGFMVPEVLIKMKNYIYEHGGLYLDGIFRVKGDSEETKRVKDQLNRGTFEECKDIHVMASLIKMWFREYPTLMLQPLDEKVFESCANESECIKAFNGLPESQKNLMLWLLDLLADVAAFEKENAMTPKNLAIVLAPNLYVPLTSDPMESMRLSQKVATFVFNVLNFRLRERYQ